MKTPSYGNKKIKILPGDQPITVGYARGLVKLTQVYKYSKYKVPVGYISDGSSIPRLFWVSIGSPFLPEFRSASIVHDYLYSKGIGKRKEADKIYRELLKCNHVVWWRRNIQYIILRLFGWITFRN